jgi:hypothetical protein
MIVAFMERYDKKAGIGTIIATMLPYTIVFLISWLILLIIWILADVPIGPGSPLFYEISEAVTTTSSSAFLKEISILATRFFY